MLDAALPSEIDYDHSLPHNSVATNGTAGFASTPGSGYKKRKMEEPPPGRLEEVRRLISPLSKDQLIDILARAASVHDDVYKEAEAIVSESPASRRLMIRNVAFSTTDESFNNLIKTYGEVDDAVLVRERDGRSKGFGFVTYKDLTSVNRILKDTVQLDGRELLIKLAADPYGSNAKTPNEGKKKLFIRNLSDKTTKDSLANAFSQFGDIEETVIVQDVHGKSKGYGFVVYSRPEDAIRAVQQPQRIVDGRMTFVSFAALGKNDRHVHGGGPGAPHFGGGSPGAPLSSGAAMGVAMGGHSPGMSMMGPLQGMGYYNSSGAAANGTAGLTSHQMAGGGQMGAHHTQHGGMAAAHYGHAGQMGQQVGSMGQQGQVGQMPGPPPPYYQQQQQAAGYPR